MSRRRRRNRVRPIEQSLESLRKQAGRQWAVRTPLGEDALLLEWFRGREEVSRLYEFEVGLLRSNSLGKTGGCNEITMDDTSGAEGLFLKAQHDETHVVGNDQVVSIGNNRTTEVGVDSLEKIGNNMSLQVGVNAQEAST